ncbi:MAG: WG repeat-containing protein [Terriglobales bacterium]
MEIFRQLSSSTLHSGDYNVPVHPPSLKSAPLLTAIVMLFFCPKFLGQTSTSPTQTGSVDGVLKPENSNGTWGYVNSAGLFVIKPKFFAAQPFKEGVALVVTQKPWQPLGSEYGEFRLAQITYIDNSGHEIRPPLSVRRAASFSDGLAVVVPDSTLRIKGGCAKGGYLNTKVDWAIKPQFDDLRDFSEGLAAVNLGANCLMGGKWGYVDKGGQTAIPFKFVWAGTFHNGRACVREMPPEDEVIDRSGNIIPGEKCR